MKQRIEEANARALDVILNAQPTWVDVVPAGEFLPDLPENMVLHAGPPMDPGDASVPFRNAIGGAAVHAGLAGDLEDAWAKIERREILLGSQLDHLGASGAANPVALSTPVQVVENTVNGKRAYCTFQEGPSPNVLRWGVYNEEVEDRLRWFDEVLGPVVGEAVRLAGGINIRSILARAESMGDENHSRQVASTALLGQQLIPALMDVDVDHRTRTDVVKFLCVNERFFLHVFIAGAAAVMEGVKGIDYCTLLVGQGGNGHEFGTKFGFSGNDWYVADCPVCEGMFINPEWGMDVAGAYLGDSCVVETYGFGGCSAAAGPSVVRLTGGDLQEAYRRTDNAREICVGTLDWAPIPWLNFQGPPVGIDMRKVVATGIAPVIHGGMHHKFNGGQAGAGSTTVPMECFVKGVKAFASRYGL